MWLQLLFALLDKTLLLGMQLAGVTTITCNNGLLCCIQHCAQEVFCLHDRIYVA